MAFQSVPDCAEAVISGTLGAKTIVNVLNFARPGGYIQADIDALAALVDARVGSDYKPLVTGGATYDGTLVRGLDLINDLQASDATSAGVGGVGGASLPNNCTLCITLRSGLTGRSARGRFFAWPTGAGNLAAANAYNSTYGGALVAFLQGVQTDAAAAGWTLVVVSRRTLGAPRLVGTYFPIISVGYRNLITDSQRGRLPVGH